MHKHPVTFTVVLAAILLLVGAVLSHAAVSSFTYQVPEPELRTSGDHVYYAIEGFGSSTTPYYPVLPTRKVHFEIPYAATDVTVTVTPGSGRSLGMHEDYLMRTPPLLLGVPDYQPPAAPERIPDVIPAETFLIGGVREFRGHRTVEIVVYPIRYEVGGDLTYIPSYSIDVQYFMAVDTQASEDMARREKSRAFEPLAAEIIENYDDFNGAFSQGLPPTPLYDLNNPQMAIITTPTFETQAEALAAWKTKKGVPTEVYLVSWITSNFSGYDTQEKIRNFLRIDNSTPRFDYVLLIGDTNTIPIRMCWSQDGDQVPCDYYYSDVVDGTSGYDWDTDNDHVWGEFSDTITWLPDIYVGRIASRSASEVETIVNNIISYEQNPPSGAWAKKAVFGAAFANYPESGGYPATDMAAVAEWVQDDFLDPESVPYERLYEAAGVYPTTYTYDYPITASNFESRVGLGCGFAFPSGHGNRTGNYRLVWAWDNGNDEYDDGEGEWYTLCTTSYNPSTGGEKPYVLVGACLAGEVDATDPCLGDFIIANWGIGAVASSRTSYYCVGWDDPDWPWNQGQEYRWWEEIWGNGKTHLGQIHGDNKYNYAVDFNTIEGGDYGPDEDYASRKNMFSSNLFGDPEVPVWTDEAEILSVVHNGTLPTGSSPFSVTVSSGGPVEGATVCLWKGTEVYLVDETNSSGVASFTPSPSTGGTMYVTVTKHNYKPYEGSATVTAGDTEPPQVTVSTPDGGESWAIDSFFDVQWIATDNVGVTSIDILLSIDGGATYPTTIATGEANDGVYSWQVEGPPTTQARIKVIAHDAAGNDGEDASDADFEITDGEVPQVTVTSPNGGESWDIDSFFDVQWIATDNVGVTSIDILLSSDGGATYPHTIATGEANDGVYSWHVDVAPTAQARVKVIAYDAALNSGEDASDADFEITDGEAPQVTVVAPNGGEVIDIDSFFDVQWIATDNIGVTSIDILLSSDGGATYPHTIATGEANDGVYSWYVDVEATTEARIKVVALDAEGNSGEDVSDADFEVYDPQAGIAEQEIPSGVVIAGATPNPFTERTSVRFGIPNDGHVRLGVYDVSGREVATLADGDYAAGYHSVEWQVGSATGTGVYFIKLRSGSEELTRKVVISQ
jgi:hypothetical protein